jgi:hypothetical protein
MDPTDPDSDPDPQHCFKRLVDVFQTCERRLRRPPPPEAPPPRRAGPCPPPSPSGSAPYPTPPGQRTLTGTGNRIRNSELRRSGSLIFYRKIKNKFQKKNQYFILGI